MKGRRLIAGIAFLFFSLILTVSLGAAQGPGPEPDEEAPQPGVQAVMVAVPRVIPIQGQLTDATGTPITGAHNIILTLYTAEGAVMCQSTKSVYANNGLFNTVIDTCSNTDINGKELTLGIQVDGDAEMTPRQQLYPVPYAYSLVPGAVISDTLASPILSVRNNAGDGIRIDADDYGIYVGRAGRDGIWVDQAVDDGIFVSNAGDAGLWVANAGGYGVYVASAGSHGVFARSDSTTGRGVFGIARTGTGVNYGVYGLSNSPDGYGVSGANYEEGGVAIMAEGTGIIKSVADTDIAVSVLKTVFDPDYSNNPDVRPNLYGDVYLRPTGTGTKYAMVPVDLFSQLFGAEQKLKSIRVCYRVANAGSRISIASVYYANESGNRTTLLSDYTNRASTTFTCYTYTDDTPDTINGPVFVMFTLYYNGTGSSYDIRISAITLTLTEN